MVCGSRFPHHLYVLRRINMKIVAINEESCMACGLCKVYCVAAHSRTGNVIKAWKAESPRAVPRIRVEKKGEICFSLQCRHCDQPWCVYSCLTGAMSKDPETGVVILDADKCIGCWTCILACPHGAITRDVERKISAKCDLCQGKEIPACVANCPNEALSLVESGKSVTAKVT
jgi:anaerobic carbon-monoxide dehydrogenase iron sulfur subunit